jgi:tRNA(fMet)-specific endonuclease VapC
MRFLWDTDTCVYFLNGHPAIQKMVESVGAEEICTTIISIAELKYGAYNSMKTESNLQRIKDFQESLVVLSELDENITTTFAKNKCLLKKAGIIINDFDLLIASFATEAELIVVTNNTKHFSQIPNLKTQNWIL